MAPDSRGLSTGSERFALSVRCDLAEVQPAAHAIHNFLARHGIAEQILGQCELALVEACNNAIQNSSPAAAGDVISVQAQLEGPAVEISVVDHNLAFDFPTQAELPAPESESGRGLYLIRRLMDWVEYRQVPSGNELVMRKRLDWHKQS